MNLSISNIAWPAEDDNSVYGIMREFGFSGLEIAPTRIFPENPYEHKEQAKCWAAGLMAEHGLRISSMQSIWSGRSERLFGSKEERASLILYTKKAIDFAEAIGCENIVFGCPKYRALPNGCDSSVAKPFFREIGDYAFTHHTVVALEANPPVYQTNFINTTQQALDLIKEIDSSGFRLNLDIGTMLCNSEVVSLLDGNAEYINHVHVSEPGLKAIAEHELHRSLAAFLRRSQYRRYISIEMGKQDDISEIRKACARVKEIFGDI